MLRRSGFPCCWHHLVRLCNRWSRYTCGPIPRSVQGSKQGLGCPHTMWRHRPCSRAHPPRRSYCTPKEHRMHYSNSGNALGWSAVEAQCKRSHQGSGNGTGTVRQYRRPREVARTVVVWPRSYWRSYSFRQRSVSRRSCSRWCWYYHLATRPMGTPHVPRPSSFYRPVQRLGSIRSHVRAHARSSALLLGCVV